MDNMDAELTVISSRFKRNWGWLLALGVFFVLLGTLGLGMSAGITVFSMYFFSVLLFLAGFSQVADAWYARSWKAVLWHAGVAILYMVAAALIAIDPIMASTIITAILAWTFIFIGTSRLVMLFSLHRAPGWGWMVFSAISAIILGVLVLAAWPLDSVWFIGLLIAIELMISGWTYILMALAIRNM